jgi:hypothetical protein
VFHLNFAKKNGNTEGELIGATTHLAFYAGWPKAMAAMSVAKRVFRGSPDRWERPVPRQGTSAPVLQTGRCEQHTPC